MEIMKILSKKFKQIRICNYLKKERIQVQYWLFTFYNKIELQKIDHWDHANNEEKVLVKIIILQINIIIIIL